MKTKGPGTFNCPACRKPAEFKIRIKVYAFHAPESATGKSEVVDNTVSLTDEFACPRCRVYLQRSYRIEFVDTIISTIPIPPEAPERQDYSEKELEMLARCHANGVMEVFSQVATLTANGNPRPPKNMDRQFISFLRIAKKTKKKKKIPTPILQEFVRAFGGNIVVYSAIGITMVVSDGEIRRFLPTYALNVPGRKERGKLGIGNVVMSSVAENVNQLNRTSYGIVPRGTQLFNEALKHSTGDHGRDMRPVRFRRISM